ncbi:UNVERIFIED_CONTAM: hypothetical protein HDU68_005039, partial [Siphonaria sp. JEL0065]
MGGCKGFTFLKSTDMDESVDWRSPLLSAALVTLTSDLIMASGGPGEPNFLITNVLVGAE